MIFISLIILVVSLIYLYLTRNYKYWSEKGVRFVKPILFFGNLKDVCFGRVSMGEYLKRIYESELGQNEPYVGLFHLDKPSLMIKDPEILKHVLVKDFDIFRDRTVTTNEKHDGVGSNMLFLLKSKKWAYIRKRISPVFSSGKIKSMTELMCNSAKEMVDYVSVKVSQNEPMEVRDLFTRFSVDTIASTGFGLSGGSFSDPNSPFRAISKEIYNWAIIWRWTQMFCFFMAHKIVPLFHMRFVDKSTGEFFRSILWKAINYRQETKKNSKNDLIDIIIDMKDNDKTDDNKPIAEDVLVGQVTQFFFRGFETTSMTLTFLMMELARNPEIQKKVREDILSARNKYGGLTYEAFQEMEYLESAVYEAIRKYPVLPFLDRRCNKRYEIPGTGLTLEEGENIFIPVMGIHYDPNYYPDPQKFYPERFYKENSEARHKITFLGFGAGLRNCIGQRFGMIMVKACISHLLSKFEVRWDESRESQFKLHNRGISLQPEGALFFKFEEIK